MLMAYMKIVDSVLRYSIKLIVQKEKWIFAGLEEAKGTKTWMKIDLIYHFFLLSTFLLEVPFAQGIFVDVKKMLINKFATNWKIDKNCDLFSESVS